jgi:CRP/FNR family cyclic AMP-dependent transcriptional regulator
MASDASMMSRFSGDAGKQNLIEALGQQGIVGGDRALAERLASVGTLVQFDAGATICEQDDSGNDVFFLINGSVNVFVNHQIVATRNRGTIVGEMAAVDPAARRSATVKAATSVVALRLSAAEFKGAGNDSAPFWRFLVQLTGERLRERAKFHLPANPTPIMFVGSSVEGLPIAREIEVALKHDPVLVRLWTSGVFGPGAVPIENLLQQVEQADFALFVFGPDDRIQSRDETYAGPRDNVVFELGLFMGRLGRDRVFMARDQDVDLKIPSDLSGVNPITYKCKPGCTTSDIVGTVCTDLRKVIAAKGAVTHRMRVLP